MIFRSNWSCCKFGLLKPIVIRVNGAWYVTYLHNFTVYRLGWWLIPRTLDLQDTWQRIPSETSRIRRQRLAERGQRPTSVPIVRSPRIRP